MSSHDDSQHGEEIDDVSLTDMTADEVQELLSESGIEVSIAEVEHMMSLILNTGSIEEAVQLLAQLPQQKAA
ncbi:hypothetical protein Psta_2190 [Pirellula staleyi DSM 6068]|uniref:Uncharacterized protein n=1 Tax=Pirellula staleyi (strain ATCC 27377 / DSM 6068 / ICPB 4128) TaxID=530564 RepID=D2R2M2_PIRSD|nr:hypothetical protein [Pirellula staleyi]ADB16862.1 hypothetical protein Psta_2190 [Pirellula staleyi DSM 6068]